MQNKKPDMELRQEQIRDLLGVIPPHIVRWGTAIIGIVFILILTGAAWFKYPDRISGTITLTTINPPIILKARKDGRLLLLNVKDGDSIVQGQLLGVLESSASFSDFFRLDTLVRSLESDPQWIKNPNDSVFRSMGVNLGEWQASYSLILKAVQDWLDFNRQGSFQAKTANLVKQRRDYKELYNTQLNHSRMAEEILSLKEKQLKRIEQLKDSGSLAYADYEAARSEFLHVQGELEELHTQISKTRIDMDQVELAILANRKDYEAGRDQRIVEIKKSLNVLAGMIADWKMNYAFISPANGTISLTRIWSRDQHLIQGERLLAIMQGNPGEITGRMLLPKKGAGKVRTGQKVIVRLDDYPYMEYGFLTGQVEKVSIVSDQDFYSAEISFPEQMKTTYSEVLDFTQEMTGVAEIITEQVSFLVRMINPIRSLLSRER